MTPESRPHERTLVFPFEWRDSGDPKKDEVTLRGHAAVWNSLSEDLGGFREKIEPGFFREALRAKPDVRLLINHDGLPLARTSSGTLELREDDRGLHVFARLDRGDSDVERLRRKMQRGDVDQMSFAFSLREDGDEWDVAEDGAVVRTLRAGGADGLFDVSVVTFPAYRSTEVSMRSVLQDAISRGRLPDLTLARAIELTDESEVGVAPMEGADEPSVAQADEPVGEEREVELEAGPAHADPDLLAELKANARSASNAARESYLRLLKENGLT